MVLHKNSINGFAQKTQYNIDTRNNEYSFRER